MTGTPGRQYLYKAFILLPFTFLFAPIFYPLLAYRPGLALINRAFPIIIYLWYAFFIYFGMLVILILRKYRYLAYPIIVGAAFFARYAAALPALDFQRVYFAEGELIYVPLTADELAYFMLVLFITSALAGCMSAVYARKTALDFMKRGNAFLFLNLALLGGLLHGSVIYLGMFAATYFIARNYILINRELEVYGEKGAYNTSGVRRVILYYFCMTALFSVAPLVISAAIVPSVIDSLSALGRAAARLVANLIVAYERDLPDLHGGELPYRDNGELLPELLAPGQLDDVLVYNIMLIAALTVLVLLRKPIFKAIKELAVLFISRIKIAEREQNKIINQEIITELPKNKRGRAAYRGYLKKSRAIADASQRFLLAYSRLHWELVGDSGLKAGCTPRELAATCADISHAADLYEAIKYGQAERSDELVRGILEQTELMLKRVL